MAVFFEFLKSFGNIVPILRTIAVVLILIIVFNIILGSIKRSLLKRVKTKKQISNIEIFSKIIKYSFFIMLIVFGILTYTGSLAGLGITIGLLSAALGFALQKPITGIAAWIMAVSKRPFEIGDRVIIGNVKGDVEDITLTHIYIKEIGGIVNGEENSGRVILVPNSVLFEQNIINYTSKDDFIMDQVKLAVTYESNLDKAMKIGIESAKKHTKDFIKITKKEPYIRTFFQPSGINVCIRYYSPAKRIQEFSSKITKEIHERVMKTKDVEFAYPHTEVILKKRK